MANELMLSVNGAKQAVSAAPETPLLFVLRNELKLSGPRLGCGMAQCGACSVLLDGEEVRACITPISYAVGKQVTTIEGLPAVWAMQKGLSAPDATKTWIPSNKRGLTSKCRNTATAKAVARQLDRCMKSGVVMGLSKALKEEVTFEKSKVTSTNWTRYKILTMEETPEIKVVQISRDDKGFGGGSEAANAVAPPAVAAAFFDATGVHARRIPLTPAYVTALLRG